MRDVQIQKTKSLEKAIKILNCFSFESPYMTIDSIVQLTGLPKATAYRLLHTLECYGLIHYNTMDNTYCLGMKMLEYGGIVLGRLTIRGVASPHLTALHHNTRCTVLLGILEADHLVYIDKRDSYESMGYTSTIGRFRDPHYGVLGKVLMAYLTEEETNRLLQAFPLKGYTKQTIIDRNEFLVELTRIRQQGYGVDLEEIVVGAIGVAAPIRNRWGQVVAAVAAIGPKEILLSYPLEDVINEVKQCANQISFALGYEE